MIFYEFTPLLVCNSGHSEYNVPFFDLMNYSSLQHGIRLKTFTGLLRVDLDRET